jgi:hypothetical protein
MHTFMEAHVFAVWDFQSLLKALQRLVTCVEVPWLPTSDPEARRFINEIVLDEESDQTPRGGYLSHFELYVQAMTECGANVGPIQRLIQSLRAGRSLEEALDNSAAPAGVRQFVHTTMGIALSAKVHCIVAAFAYGREEIIPTMFRRLVDQLAMLSPQSWETFRYYLDRHIGMDADRHGPQSRNLLERLCLDNALLWSEAVETAKISLHARIQLWDNVLESLAPRVTNLHE